MITVRLPSQAAITVACPSPAALSVTINYVAPLDLGGPTLGAMTQVAFATPVITGTATNGFVGVAQSADGGGGPAVTGEAAQAFASISLSASGSPVVRASATATFGGPSQAASGDVVARGGASQAFSTLLSQAVAAPVVVVAAHQFVGGLSQASDGAPRVTGQADQGFRAVRQSAAGSFSAVTGEAGSVFASLSQAAVMRAAIMAQSDTGFGSVVQSAAGSSIALLAGYSGFTSIAQSATGSPSVAVAAVGVFASPDQTSDGAPKNTGVASSGIPAAIQTADAAPVNSGQGSGAFADLNQIVVATSAITGQVANVLEGVAQAAQLAAPVTAQASGVFSASSQTAEASAGSGDVFILADGVWNDDGVWSDDANWSDGPDTATATGVFSAVAQAAAGTPAITGSAAQSLAGMTQAAFDGTAPTISISSGSGYAGSTYTATMAGQWTADGEAIPGQTGETFTMTPNYEGAAIQCNGSNTIEMWVPTDAAQTVQAWFDAMRPDTITKDASNRVSAWASKIGSVTLSQATAGSQPTYSATGFDGAALPEVTPYGANNYATIYGAMSNATPYLSCFTVGRFISGGGRLVSTTVAAGSADWNNTASACVIKLDSSAIYNQRSGTSQCSSARSTSKALMDSIFDGAQAHMRSNATPGGFATSTATFGYTLLSLFSQQTGGDQARTSLGEVILYHANLSTDDTAKLDGYRAWRWGLQANLPSGHAYASAPPRVS